MAPEFYPLIRPLLTRCARSGGRLQHTMTETDIHVSSHDYPQPPARPVAAAVDRAPLEQRLQSAIQLVREAGSIARQAFYTMTTEQIDFKGPQDVLTAADLAVERHLRQRLSHEFPDDSLLGEELGGEPDEHCWVIDPIDGTANFARGIPHFCIVLAFISAGQTRFGVIFDPLHDELYVAQQGRGATCNDQPIQVAQTHRFDAASLELGWNRRRPTEHYMMTLGALLAHGANVRRGACGALALAYVASGRSDGYLELHMHPWDCLAGLLLVREAGGVTLDPSRDQAPGSWPHGGPVLAATPALAAAMAEAAALPFSPPVTTRIVV